jgi:hypothetical protein
METTREAVILASIAANGFARNDMAKTSDVPFRMFMASSGISAPVSLAYRNASIAV